MTKKKQKVQKVDWKIVCTGLICLTIAELYALSQGINGVVFTIYVGIIAGAVGVTIQKPKFIK